MNPYKTDILFRLIAPIARKSALLAATVYAGSYFAGIAICAYIDGGINGADNRWPHESLLRIVCLGCMMFVGLIVLCRFYGQIMRACGYLQGGEIIASRDSEQLGQFLRRWEGAYNNIYIASAAAILALGATVFGYLSRSGHWSGYDGGCTAVYARLFGVANWFWVFLVTYKCFVTVWGVRRALRFEVVIRPLHPDRSGGLEPIGKLSLSISYILSFLMVFLALTYSFDDLAKRHPVLIIPGLLIYISAPFMMLGMLSEAHEKMKQKKREAIERLRITLDHYYAKLIRGSKDEILDTNAAEDIRRTCDLNEVLDKTPVWPLDIGSITRFLTTTALPAIVFLFDVVMSRDSWVHELLFGP